MPKGQAKVVKVWQSALNGDEAAMYSGQRDIKWRRRGIKGRQRGVGWQWCGSSVNGRWGKSWWKWLLIHTNACHEHTGNYYSLLVFLFIFFHRQLNYFYYEHIHRIATLKGNDRRNWNKYRKAGFKIYESWIWAECRLHKHACVRSPATITELPEETPRWATVIYNALNDRMTSTETDRPIHEAIDFSADTATDVFAASGWYQF